MHSSTRHPLSHLQSRLLDRFHKKIQFCGQPCSFPNSFQAKCKSESLREPVAAEIPTRATQQKLWRRGVQGYLRTRELCSLPTSPLNPWFTLHRRILRPRESHQHTLGHSAGRWQSLDWNPLLSDSLLLYSESSTNGCAWL